MIEMISVKMSSRKFSGAKNIARIISTSTLAEVSFNPHSSSHPTHPPTEKEFSASLDPITLTLIKSITQINLT